MAIKNFQDISSSVKQHMIMRDSNEAQYQYFHTILLKSMPTNLTTARLDGLPGAKMPYIPMDIILEKMDMFYEAILLEEIAIKKLEEQKSKYIDFIFSLNGLHYLIAQMYIIDQIPLKEIAERTNYSYDYIRHLSTDIKEKFNIINDCYNNTNVTQ